MKQIFTLLLLVAISSFAFAQPVNDDCSGVINLGDAPICPSPAVYTNTDATPTDIGNDNLPPCFGAIPVRDVWFSFNAVASIAEYQIDLTGIGNDPILQPQVAVYRGDCGFDQLVLLECANSNLGDTDLSLVLSGLTPGITYYIRVTNWQNTIDPNSGDFELCVQEFQQTEFNVNEGGSDLCSGTLYDSGGPNANYGLNENHIFSICPANPQGCIVFSMSQYNVDNGGDNIILYDGPDINSPVLGSIIDGNVLSNGFSIGGVCYEVTATSGCLTVQFLSNGFNSLQGFEATWECTDDCPPPGQLDVSLGPDFAAIEGAMQNPFFDITVTNVNCEESSYGLFNQGDETSLGMNDGLLLTTGLAEEVANPASFAVSNDLGQGGDPDLNFLDQVYGTGFPQQTSDVCVVEMDVVAKTDQIGFDYIFGSDEYKDDFSQFSDDLIAVLIQGPGISGLPGINGQENLAWVPGSINQSLVQVQRINAATNWEYFRDNLRSENIAYNGLTSGFLGASKTLYAGSQVTPCETYQVKIAIGDTDPNDDSGLFIQSSSLGYPAVSIDYNTGIDYLVEGCTTIESEVVISLPQVLNQDFTPNVTIGGTATPIVDYGITLPSNPTIPAGTTELRFPISVVADGIVEGTETIEIALSGDFGCGVVVFSSVLIEIKDELDINILPDQDTILVCDGIFTADLQATGAASYLWEPTALFSSANSATTIATISSSQTVSVTGTVGTCEATEEVFLQIVSPSIDIQPDGPVQICEGESVQLQVNNNVGNAGLEWSPTLGLSNPQSPNPLAAPSFTTTYTATVSATDGCSVSDEITINVEPFDFPDFVIGDSTICQNSTVQLATAVPGTTTTFAWMPDDALDDPTAPNAMATPDNTTTYTLTATSENGLCTESATTTITVLPADVDIAPDTIDLCIGDSTFLNAVTSTGGVGLTWSPTDSLTQIDLENVSVKPSVSTFYYATLEVGTCTVVDSVFVRVDSLPQITAIEAIPTRETYCVGETVSLISPNYEAAFFPDIMFQWNPAIGAISEDTLFNLAISAIETTTYVRQITNNACATTDTIEIVVIPVANIEITPQDPEICPGETVQLNATADQQIDEWEWSPEVGLSCSDCTDPIASPPSTITYQVTGEFMGCPSSAQVTVSVSPPPVFQLPNPAFICAGESIILNNLADQNATYEWLNEDGSLLSNDPQPEVSPDSTSIYTLNISNGVCPDVSEEITVNVIQDFTFSVSEDMTICQEDALILTASVEPEGANVSFVWEDPSDSTVTATFYEIPAGTLLPGSSNTYIVTAASSMGCFTYVDEITIDVFPTSFSLDSVLSNQMDTLYEGVEISFTAFTTPQPVPNATYEWSFNDQVYATTNNGESGPFNAPELPDNVGSELGVFSLSIISGDGCSQTWSDTLLWLDNPVEVPNVFTPNEDGTNDVFSTVSIVPVDIKSIRIWNRWGKLVFDNEDDQDAWDGSLNDEAAASDVYVYEIQYSIPGSENVYTERGDVTLLR